MAIAPEIPLNGSEELFADPREHAEQFRAVAQNELRNLLDRLISNMDDIYRIPIILYYFEETNLDTIAAILEIPVGTVKSRLFKGRSILREALEKEGYDEPGD
jgi:RNA polymerase sigma-70 factor (ECF subfamily)